MPKTNIGLVEYAKKALGLPYWNGTFGQVASESLYRQKKAQLPSQYTANDFSKQYGKVVHDCSGLIKGYLWKGSFASAPKYNGAQDAEVSAMYSICTEKGDIKSIPELPGLLAFLLNEKGAYHVGVYIGNGEVIEARGHAYGVIKSQTCVWHKWGRLPWITYEAPKVVNKVYEWQKAAKADGFSFPIWGIDGEWGAECEAVAKKALVQIWRDGIYRFPNLTKIVQRAVGAEPDGYCGPETTAKIKAYQSKCGLKPDGGVGLYTWKKILEAK